MAYTLEGVQLNGRLGQRLANQQMTGPGYVAPPINTTVNTTSNPGLISQPPPATPFQVYRDPAPPQYMSSPTPPQVAPQQVMSSPTPAQVAPAANVNTGVSYGLTTLAPNHPGTGGGQTLAPNQVGADGSVGAKNPTPFRIDTASLITGVQPAAPIQNRQQVTGGNFPATQMPQQPVQAYVPGMNPANVVNDITQQILGTNSPLMENARRRGAEIAAGRGLRNSTIASGASARAMMEAGMPLIGEALGIHQARESMAFTGEQNQLDRNQQLTMSQVQNWLNDQQFQREFNGTLSLLPITSSANLMATIQQYALEKPEIYTPDVINGFANFFQSNFASMLRDYFPQYYGGGSG